MGRDRQVGEEPGAEGDDAGPQRPGYLAHSRQLGTSLLLVTPLFLFYQVGILLTDGWKNGADFVTDGLWNLANQDESRYLIANFAIFLVLLTTAFLRGRHKRPTAGTLFFVVMESTIYASLMGGVIVRLLQETGLEPPRLAMSTWDSLVLSVGAGAYEELVFRLLLLGGLIWLLRRLKLSRFAAISIAVVVSSLLFSGFHYAPLGLEAFQLWSFSFRLVAGVVFAGLYLTRGFAVAVYTHAIYDVFALVI